MNNNAIELAQLLSSICTEPYIKDYYKITELLYNTLKNGNTVFICGNGGSHAIALHFAEELTGRFQNDKKPYPVMTLGEATHTTCVANDYGFQYVFSRQVEAFGKPGDLLIAMSTSGNSGNIIEAIETAKQKNIQVISLLGKDGGKAAKRSTIEYIVPSNNTARIQEIHQFLLHSITEDILKFLP